MIPVFNGQSSVRAVVETTLEVFADHRLQIVLVDDGSRDESAAVCSELVRIYQGEVIFIQLARNFGEHNAVLAGLAYTTAPSVAVLDDDGQNPPGELPKMFAELLSKKLDVVYGRYVERKHSFFRRLGSAFNDRVANLVLGKPVGLYLSSFKVMNRFLVDEIIRYAGPYPYIDGLICRTTDRLGQIPVNHSPRSCGHSNYTLTRLLRLWFNMFLGFSILPLRLASICGVLIAASSCLWLVAIFVDKVWISPELTSGIPTVLACIVMFSGVQLTVMGMIGEYVGRSFLAGSGRPQYIVRKLVREGDTT